MFAEEQSEASLHARQSDAVACGGASFRSWVGVSDEEQQASALEASVDGDAAAVLQLFDAVADRVLEHRLKDQLRHDAVERARLDVDRHLEPFGEAHRL